MTDHANLDPVTIAVIRTYLLSASQQMRNVLVRASFNPVIYEMIDFSIGLYNDKAELLAESKAIPHFQGTLRFAIRNVVDYVGEHNIVPGDVFFSTYPYWTGSHSQDAVVICPIFIDGAIFGYAGCKAHWMDIGANDIYGTSTTDIWQEGLQVFGARVRVAGRPNDDVIEIIRANSRLPHGAIGDLNAQIAACELGGRRLCELVAKYGAATVKACCNAILDHGEQVTRQAIRDMPDGEWTACGALDDNGITRDPVPITVTVRVKGDCLSIDTTGSADQQAGPMNAPFPATISFARLAVKRLLTPLSPANEGYFRPLEVIAPKGSIFNPNPPAPVFLYGYAPYVMGELVMEALAQALPRQAIARSGGNECALLFSGVSERDGGYFAGADIDGCGQGAGIDGDGESAVVAYYGGDSRNIPIEVTESKFPIRTLRYELRADSCGAGKQRGGLGVTKVWKALSDLSFITVVEQTKSPPKGLFGGENGAPDALVFNAGSERQSTTGKQSSAILPAGAELHLHTGGGGGWGRPAERDPAAVLDDVREGYISVDSARDRYGVVIARKGHDLVLDAAATAQRRGP